MDAEEAGPNCEVLACEDAGLVEAEETGEDGAASLHG